MHLVQLVVRQCGLESYLRELFDVKLETTCVFCDNQSCVKLLENPMFHENLKHIEIKYHYIKDMVQRGAMKLQYVAMNDHIAHVLTKPLARVKFEYFRERFCVLQIEDTSRKK